MTERRTVQVSLTQPQADFFTMQKKFRLFCGGYGSGKTQIMAVASMMGVQLAAKVVIGIYAPTYDLLNLVNVPRTEAILDFYGYRHKINKKEMILYTSNSGIGDFIFRSMDRPERIIGFETSEAHVDELDILPTDKARTAWTKIIARNRQVVDGVTRPYNQASVYTTPEGYRFCYQQFIVDATKEHGIVQAPSYSNPFLPADYIPSLRAIYSPELVEAYIGGQFVNLTSGSVYKGYDRDLHNSTEGIREKENLYIGQDFNVGNMASVIYVRRESGWHVVKAITKVFDTPELIKILQERYADHKIHIYPDASGKSRKTVDASTSDITLLQEAGFSVLVNRANPPIKDRINSVNKAFADSKLWVNSVSCPEVSASLEQQAFDKNGVPDKTTGHDHLNDAAGYAIVYEMPVRKPVAKLDIQFAR